MALSRHVPLAIGVVARRQKYKVLDFDCRYIGQCLRVHANRVKSSPIVVIEACSASSTYAASYWSKERRWRNSNKPWIPSNDNFPDSLGSCRQANGRSNGRYWSSWRLIDTIPCVWASLQAECIAYRALRTRSNHIDSNCYRLMSKWTSPIKRTLLDGSALCRHAPPHRGGNASEALNVFTDDVEETISTPIALFRWRFVARHIQRSFLCHWVLYRHVRHP